MKNKTLTVFSIVLAAVLLVAAVVTVFIFSDVKTKRIEVGLDFMLYSSLDEMAGDSDLIVEGKVVENRVYADTSKGEEYPNIYTISKFEITKVYNSDVIKAGDLIEIEQTGGKYKNIICTSPEISLLDKNTDYLLFLAENAKDAPEPFGSRCSILGGKQGQYTVDKEHNFKIVDESYSSIAVTKDFLSSLAAKQ